MKPPPWVTARRFNKQGITRQPADRHGRRKLKGVVPRIGDRVAGEPISIRMEPPPLRSLCMGRDLIGVTQGQDPVSAPGSR